MASYLEQNPAANGYVANDTKLYNTSRKDESAFVDTAPSKGYLSQEKIPTYSQVLASGVPAQYINQGYVNGLRARYEDERANAVLGMKQEQQSWERTDREKKRMIDDGMMEAANAGGYEGVIDYLKGVDPDRAMQFTQQKLSMDKSMMENDMYAYLSPLQKTAALVEGYGALGKMGSALLKAPPQDRQKLYDTMMPMVKTVNPNAPTDVNQAAPMFLLAAAQATPANQLFKANLTLNDLSTNAAKLQKDRAILSANGQDTSFVDGQIQALQDKAQQTHLDMLKTQLQVANGGNVPDTDKVVNSTEAMNKTLASASTDYGKFMTNYAQIASAIDSLNKDPKDAYAQNALARTFAMQVGRGKLDKSQAEAGIAGYGAEEWDKKINSWLNNEKVILQPWEQQKIINFYQNMANTFQSRQLSTEQQFKDSAAQYGTSIDAGALRWPSQQYNAIKYHGVVNDPSSVKQAPAAAISEVAKNPALLPDFIKFYGYNPTQVPQQSQPQQQQAPTQSQSGYQ